MRLIQDVSLSPDRFDTTASRLRSYDFPAGALKYDNCEMGRVSGRFSLETEQQVLAILDEVLGLRGRSGSFTAATPLLGALPELDSMAVVSLITALEERFQFVVDDDDVDGRTFETVGSLVAFVDSKIS